jgi:hypothetical protein
MFMDNRRPLYRNIRTTSWYFFRKDRQTGFTLGTNSLPTRDLQIVDPFDEIIRLGVSQLVLGLL